MKNENGVSLINDERNKVLAKGASIDYDVKNNSDCQLAAAASDLCFPYENGGDPVPKPPVPLHWNKEWWERMINKTYKERLIDAGQLIAAELDRIISLEDKEVES